MTTEEKQQALERAYDKILKGYTDSKKELNAMAHYIWENGSKDCSLDVLNKCPSNYKLLRNRYGINVRYNVGFAWYLLEKFFDGKIKIEE
jgi:hypothetical protein